MSPVRRRDTVARRETSGVKWDVAMQFKLTTAVAVLAIAGANQAAHAGAISSFTVENTMAIFKAAGGTDIKTETVDGEPRVAFTIDDANYVADLYTCNGAQGCQVLQFVVAYEPDPNDTIEAINTFNAKYVYGKAFHDEQKSLVSARMINGRSGSSTEQVTAELQDFIAITKILLAHMKQSGQTASYAPDARAAAFALGGQQRPSARRVKLPLNKR